MKRLPALFCTILLCSALAGCAHDYYGPDVSGSVAVGPTGVYAGGVSVGTGYYATPFIFPVLPPPLWIDSYPYYHRHYYRPVPPPHRHGPAFRPGPPRPHGPALRPGHASGLRPPAVAPGPRPGHRPPAMRPEHPSGHRPPMVQHGRPHGRPELSRPSRPSGHRPPAFRPQHGGGRPHISGPAHRGHGGPRSR